MIRLTHQMLRCELISNLNVNPIKPESNEVPVIDVDQTATQTAIKLKDLNMAYFELLNMEDNADVHLELERTRSELNKNTRILTNLIKQNSELKNRSGLQLFLHIAETARQNRDFNTHMQTQSGNFKQQLETTAENYNKLSRAQQELLNSMHGVQTDNKNYQTQISHLETEIVKKNKELERSSNLLSQQELNGAASNELYKNQVKIHTDAYNSLVQQMSKLSKSKTYLEFMQYIDDYEKGHQFLKYIDNNAKLTNSLQQEAKEKEANIVKLNEDIIALNQALKSLPSENAYLKLKEQLANEEVRSSENNKLVNKLRQQENSLRKHFESVIASNNADHEKKIALVKRAQLDSNKEASKREQQHTFLISELQKDKELAARTNADLSNQLKTEKEILSEYKKIKKTTDDMVEALKAESNKYKQSSANDIKAMSSGHKQTVDLLRKQVDDLTLNNKAQSNYIDEMNHKLVQINSNHNNQINSIERNQAEKMRDVTDKHMKELYETKKDMMLLLKKPQSLPDDITIVSKELLKHIEGLNSVIAEQQTYIKNSDLQLDNKLTDNPAQKWLVNWKKQQSLPQTTVPLEVLNKVLTMQHELLKANNNILSLNQSIKDINIKREHLSEEITQLKFSNENVSKKNSQLEKELASSNNEKQEKMDQLSRAYRTIRNLEITSNWNNILEKGLVHINAWKWDDFILGKVEDGLVTDATVHEQLEDIGFRIGLRVKSVGYQYQDSASVIKGLLVMHGLDRTLDILDDKPNIVAEIVELTHKIKQKSQQVEPAVENNIRNLKHITSKLSLSASMLAAIAIIAHKLAEEQIK